MSVKYSLLMPFHKRAQQLAVTLSSFLHLYRRNDYEVLIGEDYKNMMDQIEHHALVRVLGNFSSVLNIQTIITGTANCWNPSSAFNELASRAQGQFLIITNPECLHETDVLAGLDQAFEQDSDQYVVCACRIPTRQWYQHSVHRSVKVHFCSALSKELYNRIGGFDEEYAKGVCFEDDDFRNTIISNGVRIVERDDLVVMHQAHSKSKPSDYAKLHVVNKRYFDRKWGSRAFRAECLTVEPFQSKLD